MGADKAQQVIGCFRKSRKRRFVGIYRKKMRTNGNGLLGDAICPWSSEVSVRLNPCRHFARAVSVLNVKFRQLSNFFCQCILDWNFHTL